ncbi:aminoglycoside phosphotransferase [Paenibacillus nanensis]|uniref:Aminoglycoside phosphotransferase n=1 Tax=Paenibacillus nanensis TaxID=393251 RepID=A0A3A1UTA4_9BACL|nr:phosphotransferase [Paenibacillus nanensis]RIX48598.1 aminoglycoside phosphotransferase [Paenibacillus nanensis]
MLKALLRENWPERAGELRERDGGWNNSTYFIANEHYRSVLRVYAHGDLEKIRFEHELLIRLSGLPLSFGVPSPIPSRSGSTIVPLGDGSGKLACLFRYIEGVSPAGGSDVFAYSFGRAAGELSAALTAVRPGLPAAYPPYYRLKEAYPDCDIRTTRDFCLRPPAPFEHLREELMVLHAAYTQIMDSLEGLEKLPHQLVHGDLNASNLLVSPESPSEVTALLDFEFCTRDLRVMEPAVILSGLLGAAGEREAVRLFCRGFGSQVRLHADEMEAIPAMIRLRQVDVFLHFLTRYLNGTDEADVLQKQARMLSSALQELAAKEWLAEELLALREG